MASEIYQPDMAYSCAQHSDLENPAGTCHQSEDKKILGPKLVRWKNVGFDVAAAVAAQDTKMFCTMPLNLVTEPMKNVGVMTIFSHPEHLHFHNHADQTNQKHCPFGPIQQQMNLSESQIENLVK